MKGLGMPWVSPTFKEGQTFGGMYVYFDDWDATGYQAAATLGRADSKFSETADYAEWLVSLTDGGGDNDYGLSVRDTAHGGILRIQTTNAAEDLVQIQRNGEAIVTAAANRRILYEARVAISDIDQTDWSFGLAVSDTTVQAGATDTIGFRVEDLAADIDYLCETASTETTGDTGKDAADDTFFVGSFIVYNRDRVKFFINGEQVANITTNIPTTSGLSPFFSVRTNNTTDSYMDVDYVLVAADR